MMLRYMLDTNIVVYTIKNKSEEIKRTFVANYGQVFISTITLAESLFMERKSPQTPAAI